MICSEVALVHPADSNYKSWARRNHFAFHPRRSACPFARDYQRAQNKWEEIIRTILRSNFDECSERILRWMETDKERGSMPRYRELDYVHGSRQSPKLFVEIKQRESTTSGVDGKKQMKAALAVARSEWPTLAGVCLNVHMAGVLDLDDQNAPLFLSLGDLSGVMAVESNCLDNIPVLWIDSTDVAAYAIRSGLLTEADVDYLPRLRQLAFSPLASIADRVDEKIKSRLGDIWPE